MSVYDGDNRDSESATRHFKFPSHQSHMVTLAKMCQENKDFTDCVIQCEGGNRIKAHRLVLGAASTFLKSVFEDLPPSLTEATVVVPGVRKNVVDALLDFLYTGEMTIDREDTDDLQLLIETLQINSDLISVEDPAKCEETKAANENKNDDESEEVENGSGGPKEPGDDSRKRKADENEEDEDEPECKKKSTES